MKFQNPNLIFFFSSADKQYAPSTFLSPDH